MSAEEPLAPSPESICAVIVAYFPGEELPKRVAAIRQQVHKVVIVDNTSPSSSFGIVESLSNDLTACIIRNETNLGIATALNQGVRFAIDKGYQWVLTLDQDSVPKPGMVRALIAAYYDCPFRHDIGLIGSNYAERSTGRGPLHNRVSEGRSWVEISDVITSGTLLSTRAYSDLGPFREDFFIYYVDIEYCLRLRQKGYRIIIATPLGMQHSTGDAQVRTFLWKQVAFIAYPPDRSYYIVRNGVRLVRLYILRAPAWALHRTYSIVKRMISTLLFGEQKLITLRFMIRGLRDALISRGGRLDP